MNHSRIIFFTLFLLLPTFSGFQLIEWWKKKNSKQTVEFQKVVFFLVQSNPSTQWTRPIQDLNSGVKLFSETTFFRSGRIFFSGNLSLFSELPAPFWQNDQYPQRAPPLVLKNSLFSI